MSDERAAAERLRSQFADYSEEYRNIHQGSDEATLARAYLAEHDPEPVTAEWLKSIGFEVESHPECLRAVLVVRGGTRTDLILTSGGLLEGSCILHQGPDESIAWPVPLTTRGAVRRLLSALGIEVKA